MATIRNVVLAVRSSVFRLFPRKFSTEKNDLLHTKNRKSSDKEERIMKPKFNVDIPITSLHQFVFAAQQPAIGDPAVVSVHVNFQKNCFVIKLL